MTTEEMPFQNHQCGRIKGYNPPSPPFASFDRLRMPRNKEPGRPEHTLDTKTARNIAKNQCVIKVLKERL